MIAYGWGSVQYFNVHVGCNDQIWSLLIHPPQLLAITILPDFGYLITSSVHQDRPVQRVCNVKSEALTSDFWRCNS